MFDPNSRMEDAEATAGRRGAVIVCGVVQPVRAGNSPVDRYAEPIGCVCVSAVPICEVTCRFIIF